MTTDPTMTRDEILTAVREGKSLRNADLRYADLWYANLRNADLRYANLRYANLRNADLRYADLRGVREVLSITSLPSGHATLIPTPGGWQLRVGCWTGTTAEVKKQIGNAVPVGVARWLGERVTEALNTEQEAAA